MSTPKLYTFKPDYTIPPGEILAETLQARSISQSELASRCGVSEKHISQVVNGKASITPDTALLLEQALGIRASLWMNLESKHRVHEARLREEKRLAQHIDWANRFPISHLVKHGWIPDGLDKIGQVRALLKFFGVVNPAAWEEQYQRIAVSYRRSPAFSSSRESVSAWLQIGTILALNTRTRPYNRTRFLNALKEIRTLTKLRASVFQPRMKTLCAEAGVVLQFIPELPDTRLSGATRWISPEKALIAQSLRFRKDDHFWFTFFHEAAHVLLHGKRSVFIDEVPMPTTEEEGEADACAADYLIPSASYARLTAKGQPSRSGVEAFARELGIAPGIVVGRLQHDGVIPFSWFNDLKRTFVFSTKVRS